MTKKSTTCFKKDGEPRSQYSSEYEAEESASHIRKKHGLDISPYQCPKCGYWHLSPTTRQTPSKECTYCTDSNGNRKELYETEEAAKTRAEIIEAEQGIKLKVYKCPEQDGWHLTKNIS